MSSDTCSAEAGTVPSPAGTVTHSSSAGTVPTSTHATPTPPLQFDPAMQQFPPMAPGMPHFFANPFMSPFMPQGQPGQESNVTPVQGVGGVHNPMPFFFSPAQYQEMMQQYFQQMMASAPYNNMNVPFPMPNMQMSMTNNQRPDSQTGSTSGSNKGDEEKLASAMGNVEMIDGLQSTSSSPDKSTSISVSEAGSTVYEPHSEGVVEKDEECDSSSKAVPPSTIQSEDLSNRLCIGNTHELPSTIKGDETPESVKSEGGQEEMEGTGVRKTSLPDSLESEKESRTASLIKKQMSEYEKEISRRTQNKNIKKMDDRELAELIGAVTLSTSTAPLDTSGDVTGDRAVFAPSSTKQLQTTGHQQSALPLSTSEIPPNTSFSQSQHPKQTLDQLRNSFNLPETGPVQPPVSTAVVGHNNGVGNAQGNAAFGQSPSSIPSNVVSSSSSSSTTNVPFGVPFVNSSQPQPSQSSQLPMGNYVPHTMQPMPTMVNPSQQSQQFMQQGYQYPVQGMGGSPFYQNPFPQNVYPTRNGEAHFSQEQLAAAAVTQTTSSMGSFPNGTPFGMGMVPFGGGVTTENESSPLPVSSHSATTTVPSNGESNVGGLVPPPPQTNNPVQKRNSMPRQAGWPVDEHPEEEKGEDAVWVLRESYLKRMQRDNEASQTHPSTSDWPQSSPQNLDGNEDDDETDRLLLSGEKNIGRRESNGHKHMEKEKRNQKTSKETMIHEPAVLIEGVLFRARYLGSTQMMCESRGSKAARMGQAQEAVARVKAPEGEVQPSTDIDLFISTEKIMVLNTDLQDILMDHALRTISYIADIGDLVVLMARRMSQSNSDENCDSVDGIRKSPKVICHVFESEEASFIAQSIGQAFQVAYVEFLRANGIDDPSYLRQIDYQEVLNSQELMGDELEMFAKKETQKDVVVPKKAGEMLGVVVVESGWGSMLPTVVLAHMAPIGPAARSNQLNIGDQIIAINGISLVGLPLSAAQKNIQNVKTATAVRLTVVSTPPVVEVRIRRPDTKYQLGFSVQNGVICSLLRGGIAERGGIRVGHRIIEINHQSVVATAHDRIVNMLATAIGEIHMKTMPTSMFRLLTGQEVPNYI